MATDSKGSLHSWMREWQIPSCCKDMCFYGKLYFILKSPQGELFVSKHISAKNTFYVKDGVWRGSSPPYTLNNPGYSIKMTKNYITKVSYFLVKANCSIKAWNICKGLCLLLDPALAKTWTISPPPQCFKNECSNTDQSEADKIIFHDCPRMEELTDLHLL